MTELLVILAILVIGPLRPDVRLTPGVVRPLASPAICSTRWGRDRRHVTLTMRRAVFRRYGVPYAKHRLYELDHLVPRELGGEDSILNLWPQPYSGYWNAHLKDRVENYLHRQVCSGAMSLETAQSIFVSDWQQASRLLK